MGVDLYTVLDVNPEATPSQIRTAYFKLAKKLHPDRQAAQDPKATEHFLAVQSAYEVLIDPARREDYDRQRITSSRSETGPPDAKKAADSGPRTPVMPRGPSIEEARDASLAYQKAMNLMESGQYERALRAMMVVVRTVPDQPEYLSLLGYLMAREGEKLHTARDYCRQSVEAEPYNPDFHARLGFVYLRAGLNNTAQKCFQQALQLDPSHELASKHRGSGGGEEPAGLLGSIKKLLGTRH